jgi:hypothetical protein
VRELANQNVIKYGAKDGGSTLDFFRVWKANMILTKWCEGIISCITSFVRISVDKYAVESCKSNITFNIEWIWGIESCSATRRVTRFQFRAKMKQC